MSKLHLVNRAPQKPGEERISEEQMAQLKQRLQRAQEEMGKEREVAEKEGKVI
jgi:hypothetical protein